MSRKFIVGWDNDGVNHDFGLGVWQHLVNTGKVTGPCPDVDDWHFYRKPEWGSMTDDQFIQTCHDGVDAGIIFSHGKPHEGTVEAMNEVYNMGHRVVIVTDRAFGSTQGKESRQATFSWLREYGYKFHEVVFTAEKTKVKMDYMVDDKLENYDALKAAGVNVMLINRLWNIDPTEDGINVPYRDRIDHIDEYVDRIRNGVLL